MNETDRRIERRKGATNSQRKLWIGQQLDGYVHSDCSYPDYRLAVGLLCGGQGRVLPRTLLERVKAAWVCAVAEIKATERRYPWTPV